MILWRISRCKTTIRLVTRIRRRSSFRRYRIPFELPVAITIGPYTGRIESRSGLPVLAPETIACLRVDEPIWIVERNEIEVVVIEE